MTPLVKMSGLAAVISIGIFCLGVFVWAQGYEDRLPPRVTVNGLEVGGLDVEMVKQVLQEKIDAIMTDGVELEVENQRRILRLSTVASADTVEDASFELDETLARLMAAHRANPLRDAWAMLASFVRPLSVNIPVTIARERIQSQVLALFPDTQTLSVSASFDIQADGEDWRVEVVEGAPGKEFVWEPFFKTLAGQLRALDTRTLQLTLVDQPPRLSLREAEALVDDAVVALRRAPYEVRHDDDSWKLTDAQLADLLAPGEQEHLVLLEEPLNLWVEPIAQEVNQVARDARLSIENGRVVEFVRSLEGRTLDEKRLAKDLEAAVNATADSDVAPIELVVEIIPPNITTADVNDLGIDEVLGVGTSSYRGSPFNRRANIQNGVDLLNGLLIAPGETFSLLKALSPFTTDNGYLPELVIKGDKITPEIGGGLCQIGTTTFRAAMNAGLPIIERRNHSLVVSYYNDPANGNPGTDATIYEPAPDFKFLNDTGHYILFQAENLTDTQELRFTFWGTRDGRTASYSPPVVSRWIPVGETQYIETLDLEPGVEQCQSSHIGADASFVYMVVSAQGAVSETTFESHYRPLPRICLVGVEELTAQEPLPQSLSTEALAPLMVAP